MSSSWGFTNMSYLQSQDDGTSGQNQPFVDSFFQDDLFQKQQDSPPNLHSTRSLSPLQPHDNCYGQEDPSYTTQNPSDGALAFDDKQYYCEAIQFHDYNTVGYSPVDISPALHHYYDLTHTLLYQNLSSKLIYDQSKYYIALNDHSRSEEPLPTSSNSSTTSTQSSTRPSTNLSNTTTRRSTTATTTATTTTTTTHADPSSSTRHPDDDYYADISNTLYISTAPEVDPNNTTVEQKRYSPFLPLIHPTEDEEPHLDNVAIVRPLDSFIYQSTKLPATSRNAVCPDDVNKQTTNNNNNNNLDNSSPHSSTGDASYSIITNTKHTISTFSWCPYTYHNNDVDHTLNKPRCTVLIPTPPAALGDLDHTPFLDDSLFMSDDFYTTQFSDIGLGSHSNNNNYNKNKNTNTNTNNNNNNNNTNNTNPTRQPDHAIRFAKFHACDDLLGVQTTSSHHLTTHLRLKQYLAVAIAPLQDVAQQQQRIVSVLHDYDIDTRSAEDVAGKSSTTMTTTKSGRGRKSAANKMTDDTTTTTTTTTTKRRSKSITTSATANTTSTPAHTTTTASQPTATPQVRRLLTITKFLSRHTTLLGRNRYLIKPLTHYSERIRRYKPYDVYNQQSHGDLNTTTPTTTITITQQSETIQKKSSTKKSTKARNATNNLFAMDDLDTHDTETERRANNNQKNDSTTNNKDTTKPPQSHIDLSAYNAVQFWGYPTSESLEAAKNRSTPGHADNASKGTTSATNNSMLDEMLPTLDLVVYWSNATSLPTPPKTPKNNTNNDNHNIDPQQKKKRHNDEQQQQQQQPTHIPHGDVLYMKWIDDPTMWDHPYSFHFATHQPHTAIQSDNNNNSTTTTTTTTTAAKTPNTNNDDTNEKQHCQLHLPRLGFVLIVLSSGLVYLVMVPQPQALQTLHAIQQCNAAIRNLKKQYKSTSHRSNSDLTALRAEIKALRNQYHPRTTTKCATFYISLLDLPHIAFALPTPHHIPTTRVDTSLTYAPGAVPPVHLDLFSILYRRDYSLLQQNLVLYNPIHCHIGTHGGALLYYVIPYYTNRCPTVYTVSSTTTMTTTLLEHNTIIAENNNTTNNKNNNKNNNNHPSNTNTFSMSDDHNNNNINDYDDEEEFSTQYSFERQTKIHFYFTKPRLVTTFSPLLQHTTASTASGASVTLNNPVTMLKHYPQHNIFAVGYYSGHLFILSYNGHTVLHKSCDIHSPIRDCVWVLHDMPNAQLNKAHALPFYDAEIAVGSDGERVGKPGYFLPRIRSLVYQQLQHNSTQSQHHDTIDQNNSPGALSTSEEQAQQAQQQPPADYSYLDDIDDVDDSSTKNHNNNHENMMNDDYIHNNNNKNNMSNNNTNNTTTTTTTSVLDNPSYADISTTLLNQHTPFLTIILINDLQVQSLSTQYHAIAHTRWSYRLTQGDFMTLQKDLFYQFLSGYQQKQLALRQEMCRVQYGVSDLDQMEYTRKKNNKEYKHVVQQFVVPQPSSALTHTFAHNTSTLSLITSPWSTDFTRISHTTKSKGYISSPPPQPNNDNNNNNNNSMSDFSTPFSHTTPKTAQRNHPKQRLLTQFTAQNPTNNKPLHHAYANTAFQSIVSTNSHLMLPTNHVLSRLDHIVPTMSDLENIPIPTPLLPHQSIDKHLVFHNSIPQCPLKQSIFPLQRLLLNPLNPFDPYHAPHMHPMMMSFLGGSGGGDGVGKDGGVQNNQHEVLLISTQDVVSTKLLYYTWQYNRTFKQQSSATAASTLLHGDAAEMPFNPSEQQSSTTTTTTTNGTIAIHPLHRQLFAEHVSSWYLSTLNNNIAISFYKPISLFTTAVGYYLDYISIQMTARVKAYYKHYFELLAQAKNNGMYNDDPRHTNNAEKKLLASLALHVAQHQKDLIKPYLAYRFPLHSFTITTNTELRQHVLSDPTAGQEGWAQEGLAEPEELGDEEKEEEDEDYYQYGDEDDDDFKESFEDDDHLDDTLDDGHFNHHMNHKTTRSSSAHNSKYNKTRSLKSATPITSSPHQLGARAQRGRDNIDVLNTTTKKTSQTAANQNQITINTGHKNNTTNNNNNKNNNNNNTTNDNNNKNNFNNTLSTYNKFNKAKYQDLYQVAINRVDLNDLVVELNHNLTTDTRNIDTFFQYFFKSPRAKYLLLRELPFMVQNATTIKHADIAVFARSVKFADHPTLQSGTALPHTFYDTPSCSMLAKGIGNNAIVVTRLGRNDNDSM